MLSSIVQWYSANALPIKSEQSVAASISFAAVALTLLILAAVKGRSAWTKPRYPTINPVGWLGLNRKSVILGFVNNARTLIAEGQNKFSGPFYLNTDIGPRLILPESYIDMIAREKNLSFSSDIADQFHANLETFRTFGNLDILSGISRLTQKLALFTVPLSQEASKRLDKRWGLSTDWRTIHVMNECTMLGAHMAARVFLGAESASNDEWVQLTAEHSSNLFEAALLLRLVPTPFRYLAERLSPACRKARRSNWRALKIMQPIIDAKRAERARAAAEERAPNLRQDLFEFAKLGMKANDYPDPDGQLAAAFSATQTVADMMAKTIVRIAQNPEIHRQLREEAIGLLARSGWTKQTLTDAHLLDSVLKESIRLEPPFITALQRLAITDVELPDGLRIPKGTRIAISQRSMWNDQHFSQAQEFKGDRFLGQRQTPGKEFASQFVSTDKLATGFGHGIEACPGRFFASSLLKIALIHIVLKYDLRVEDDLSSYGRGLSLVVPDGKRIAVRRRESEIDLAEIEGDLDL